MKCEKGIFSIFDGRRGSGDLVELVFEDFRVLLFFVMIFCINEKIKVGHSPAGIVNDCSQK